MNGTREELMQESREKDKDQLRKEIEKEALVVALVSLHRGETRKAEEAMRVWLRVQDGLGMRQVRKGH